ncbi:cellulose synthase subunit BcsC-related outer membrane protein [Muricoccus radiodurans]|uniref:cellulose biosynthesis protein BcsC n=1 Tax=Muricoccus radiodurans TaxID=2231721 RepID=UPI003CF317EF
MIARTRLGLAAALLALPALAQEVSQAPSAVDVLVRQAERWLAQNRPELAAPAIERALAAEPSNPGALAVAARLEIARNNRDSANSFLARLRAAGAGQQATEVEGALRATTLDRTGLEEARRLAREGQTAAAAARYRAVFGASGPPEAYALEYYQSLAAAEGTRAEGVQNLERLASRSGATGRTRLAYAQTLTYNAATRAEGIRRLQQLADDPEAGAEARRSWAAALGYYGNDPAVAPQLEAYLRRFPDDPEVRRRLETLQAQPRPVASDPSGAARQEAFERLEGGSLTDSARRFEALIAANPNDSDALGGLGVVRLRQGNQAEARRLLERAVAADPAGGRQWQRALDGASYGGEITEARARLRRGDVDGADATARRAALREVEDRTDAEIILGEIALRRGDAAAAETRFRAALARRPNDGSARTGLNAALRAQSRPAEFRTAEPPPPRSSPRVVPTGEAPAPASPATTGLRAEAARAPDPATATALLRNAVAATPDDPWARLDLARALRRQGRGSEGRALVEELAARQPSADAAYAAALLAEEDGRAADADAFLARIPPNRRSPDMARLAARIRGQREVSAAAALLTASPIEGRSRLLTLAARPDPSGGTAAAVIRAFGAANDRVGAAEAARVATVTGRASPAARVAIAGALLSAGLEAESLALAAEVEASGASPEMRRDLAALRAGAAVRASDRLNEAGNQAAAFEQLRPALAAGPDNGDAQLALSRLYVGARQPAEALRVAETVLARDPRNLDARRAAIEAALAAGGRQRAEQLLQEAQVIAPRDARLFLLEARVARAAGDPARARAALEAAARQRAAELGPGTGSVALPGNLLSNPFARGTTTASTPVSDRLTREIQSEMAALSEAAGPTLAAAVGGRIRSGDTGLDRLNELSARIEGSFVLPGVGGRITAAAEPVTLDSGDLANSVQARARFGTAIFAPAASPPRAPSSTAAGVGLNVGYALDDWFRADVGSTPLGFRSASVVGGVEVAPRLSDTLRLRVTGERRAVTDSLLSWAGLTDPRSGTSWGPVLRTGGRAQVEFPIGAGYGYIGGGYAILEGERVASNSRIEGGAGVSIPVYRREGGEVTVGADLVYLAYDRNLRYFTLGHGGYFSPQQYAALNIPIDYRGRSGDLSYRLGATLGYAAWREDAAPYFPTDANLQSQAEALAAASVGTPNAVSATYRGQSQAGFVGGLRAEVDWTIMPGLTLGGSLRYDRAANFDETRFQLRLQNRF